MSAPALTGRLDELQRGLEGLLSCFEAQRFPEPSLMDAAWSRVQLSFDALRVELGDQLGGREAFQERVDHCLRLYAVAAGVLLRRREELAAERAACSGARQRLRRIGAAGSSGDSCDVRG